MHPVTTCIPVMMKRLKSVRDYSDAERTLAAMRSVGFKNRQFNIDGKCKNMEGYKQPDFKSERSVSAVIFETSFILMIAHRPFLNMVQLPRECTLKVKEILGQ